MVPTFCNLVAVDVENLLAPEPEVGNAKAGDFSLSALVDEDAEGEGGGDPKSESSSSRSCEGHLKPSSVMELIVSLVKDFKNMMLMIYALLRAMLNKTEASTKSNEPALMMKDEKRLCAL